MKNPAGNVILNFLIAVDYLMNGWDCLGRVINDWINVKMRR